MILKSGFRGSSQRNTSWRFWLRLMLLPSLARFGRILRRENLYSSLITHWRRQRDAGALEGLRNRKRGPAGNPVAAELRRLREENARLAERLGTAEELIDAQGNAFALLCRGRSCQEDSV